jgi:hypothetical protein
MILLLVALATWRLTSLLVYEAGPWNIFENLRYSFGVRTAEDATMAERDKWLTGHPGEVVPERFAIMLTGEILLCFYCSSLWVAFFAVGLVINFDPLPLWQILLLPFAVSAAAIVLDTWIHGES